MRLRLTVLLALAALVLSAAPAAAKPRAAKRLKTFDSCRTLVAYAARHVPQAPSRPFPDMPLRREAPAGGEGAAGQDTSQTNVQEAGVDEPDTVKTDGSTIFALAGDALHAIDARAGAPKVVSTLKLDVGYGTTMLLHEDRLLLLGPGPRGARMTEVDVSDPAAPVVRRTEDVDGWIVDARMTGRTARVVVASDPRAVYGDEELRARPGGWLPKRRVTYARSGNGVTRRIACNKVRRPPVFPGPGLLTVYTVDTGKGLPAVDVDAVFAGGDTVYASPTSLYVATQRWEAEGANTSIHRFDTSGPEHTIYAGSGVVPGTLLNQFALSEDKGVLRAASTVGFGREAESKVTTLSASGGQLVRRGQVGGLGRGERIYAVRFIGDAGYVVTFRETDPLYTLDLADPAHPVVRGELKIPGYSAYLHPVGDDLLLGVGQEATADGRVQGLQISLFDVADLARPVRLQQARLGERFSSSEVEWDHHAFLWWAPAQLAVLPVDTRRTSGAAAFRVDRAGGIAKIGRIGHPGGDPFPPVVSRSLVVGGRLFTVSDQGVKASTLASLADEGWAAFPG